MKGTRKFVAASVVWVSFSCLSSCDFRDKSNHPWFVNESHHRGIDFVHRSGFRDVPLLPEINGSGVALADLNGDGYLDIYFVQSGSLYEEAQDEWSNELYFSIKGSRFEKASADHGADDSGYGMGVAAADYDNDGDVDLYVTNAGPNVLLTNDGSGRFQDRASYAGVDDSSFGTSATFLDFDQDGYLDLFVVNYVNWSRETELECYEGGVRAYCPPQRYRAPTRNRIFRNNGDGTFEDYTETSGIHASTGYGFGVVGADFNGDRRIDLYVANDRTPNELWLNQGEFRFVNRSESYGAAADMFGLVKAGMGVDCADMDGDGDFDPLVVNLVGETDTFYRNDGSQFVDVTATTGLNLVTSRYTRWGIGLDDFDNDGFSDLYIANGRVYPGDIRTGDIYAERNVLFRGLGLEFNLVEVPLISTMEATHTSRGLAVGDIDNDGSLDLIVVNRDSEPYVLLNRVIERGNWLTFSIRDRHGRFAHGAVVTIQYDSMTRVGMVQRDGSFMSSNDPRVHFGLSSVNRIDEVRVDWPTGESETFSGFVANQFVTLWQGRGVPL